VNIYTFDDRVETPEGISVIIKQPDHPILHSVAGVWPALLGYQETKIKPTAVSIVETDTGDPLIAVNHYGKGRAMVWTTDVGPHWCPTSFAEWEGYGKLWRNAVHWLAGK
ncbi:MAG: cytoplasmic protein, partial [Firmicutes bacterium]|nr:cytoplasmic protein [Bacillota bacterium]